MSVVDLAERVARRVAGPRQALGGVEHGDDLGRRAAARAITRSASVLAVRGCGTDSGADRRARPPSPTGRRVDEPGARRSSRARPSDSRSPRFEVTSECSSSSTMRLSVANRYGASADGEQQRELLGRREQDVGRIAALALALRGRRIAGAGLDPDRQPHLGDRLLEIARDVDRERLQRRDVERVQAACPARACVPGGAAVDGASRQLDQRRQEAGERLAGAGRRDQQGGAAGARLASSAKLMGARRPAARPRTSRAKGSGKAGAAMSERAMDTSLPWWRRGPPPRRPGTLRRPRCASRRAIVRGAPSGLPPRSRRGHVRRHGDSASFAPSSTPSPDGSRR